MEVSSFDSGGAAVPRPPGRGGTAAEWDAARRANVLSRDFTVNGLMYEPR